MDLFKWLKKKDKVTIHLDSEMEKNYDLIFQHDWAMYMINPGKISPVKLMDRVWEQ